MNSARKPLRLNSDPSGYDKDGYKYKGGYSRRSSSPGEREGADQGHSNSRGYSRYNNHRHQQSSDNRDYKYGRAKDLRDSDRERDRSPRDRKNWDYKDKIRDKDVGDSRGGGGGGGSGGGGGHTNFTSYGDWSEQMSSSGKKYYYNRRTHKNQWEKPTEWEDAERARQSQVDKSRDWGDHDKVRTNSVKLHCDRNNRSSQDKHGADHRSSPVASSSVSSRHRDRLASSRGNHNNHHNNSDNNSSHHHSSSNSSSSHRNNDTAGGYSVRDWDTCRDRDRPTVSDCSTGDATPTSEDGAECDGRAEHNSTHPGGAVSLSAAISRISQPPVGLSVSTSQGPDSRSRPSVHSAQPSPGVGVSPPASPALSAVSRLQALAAPPPPIQLTPSLSRLYKEQLIGHVLAWPAEHVERGINKVGEDANQISNHAITKVSADLKMARSLVRLAEIQATLQEQRILFLRQQMTDLERLETSWVARAGAAGAVHLAATPTRDTRREERESARDSSATSHHHHHHHLHHRDSNDSRDSESASESGSLHQDHHQDAPVSLTQPSSLLGLHMGNNVNYNNV